MFELSHSFPAVNVVAAEYKRLLGYPAHCELEGRAAELAAWACDWYRDNGRPWIHARQVEQFEFDDQCLNIEGHSFHCHELLQNLRDAEATGAIVAAVSAGPELEAAAQQAWNDDKPDEYFFLEVYGSAVVEHLVTMAGAQFCALAEGSKKAVLPHYSPGYGDWDISEQARLMGVLRSGGNKAFPGPLEVLESGMLRPKKSLLAVFGLTASVERARNLAALVPCERCSFLTCQFRREQYQDAGEIENRELVAATNFANGIMATIGSSDTASQQYKINRKALERWANERLTITPGEDGTIDVLFKHEGSTCSNMGRPLLFDYHVRLSSKSAGYRILEQQCKPSANEVGYRSMCSYLGDPEQIMVAIAGEKPLLGKTLDEVLDWQRPGTTASCYCETVNRQHMWGQVLETIHYALHRN